MNLFRQFFTPSIRRRISSAFVIVTVFVLVMAVASYLQLRQVRPYSEAIIHDSLDQVQLQKLAAATSALDADLERYLVIRGAEYQESVQLDLQEIAEAFTALQNTPTTEIQPELVALEGTIAQLQLGVQRVLDVQNTNATSGEITLHIVTVYDNIAQVKQLQEELSAKTLGGLQASAQTQSQIASNVLTQFVILGVVVLLVAVFTAWTTDRRLRTISTLTSTATQIAAGDLSHEATVESNDEIGTLAQAFNNMTSQLRNFIGTLEQRVAERTQDQATVADIATRTATIQDLQEMLATMVHLTQRGFGLYHAHVFLYHENTEELQIVACGYKEGDEHEGTHGTSIIPLAAEQSLVARCARNREPVIVNDVRSDPGWLPNPLLPDTHAEMAVPMIVGDKLLGVLDVQAEAVDAFDEADATIQMTLAAQVAVAVQNILQFQTSQKMAADLGVVTEVGIATTTISDAKRLLQEVVNLSKESFNLYHAHIYLMDEEGDTLQLAAGAGEVGRQMVSEGRSIELDSEKSLVARAARSRHGVVVNDVQADPDFLPNPLLPDTHSEMAVPMLVGGKVVGVLDVQSETIGRFTEIDVNIQTTLASQVAVALENARSFQEAHKQAERETKLNMITQRIQGAGTIEESLQIAARELGHALGKRQTMVALDPVALLVDAKTKN